MKKNNETKVICPKCGAEIAIPEHEHFVAGICVGKDSGIGTIVLPSADGDSNNNNQSNKKMKTANEKIEQLKAAGVNVDNLFAMNGANGGDALVRLDNGVITPVSDDDPIFQAIIAGGTIPDRRLFRRWIASQIMHMLSDHHQYEWLRHKNVTEKIQHHGYMYSWKVLREELRVQVKLAKRDTENFIKYNRGYNKEVAVAMALDYTEKLVYHVNGLPIKKCQGRDYKTIFGTYVFCDEIEAKVMMPIARSYELIKAATTPKDLHKAVEKFYQHVAKYKFPYDTKMSDAFINAYKFTGAFFTMENFILFSNCFLWNGCIRLNKEASLKLLTQKAEEYKTEGWKLFGLLKKFLDDNKIDPDKKIEQWAEMKA